MYFIQSVLKMILDEVLSDFDQLFMFLRDVLIVSCYCKSKETPLSENEFYFITA